MDFAGASLAKCSSGISEDSSLLVGTWMGVADGLGGSHLVGVNSGNFSRQLMENCKLFLLAGAEHPKNVIIEAVSRATEHGCSTVVLGCLKDGKFIAANLGDSGFLVIRDWQILERSNPMQATFGSPRCVGLFPKELELEQEIEVDDPSIAECYDIDVKEGDIVVMASDGLFDYLFEWEIIEIVEQCISRDAGCVQDVAVRLVNQARSRMHGATPYVKGCRVHGERMDDLTVIVGRVVPPENKRCGDVVELKQFDCDLVVDLMQFDENLEEKVHELSLGYAETGVRSSFGMKVIPTAAGHQHDFCFEQGSWLGIASELCDPRFRGLCGRYSSALAATCAKLAATRTCKKPSYIIKKAVALANKKRKEHILQSALIVLSLEEAAVSSKLLVANIGDSRVLILRDWEVVAATDPMCHGSETNALDGSFAVEKDLLENSQVYELDVLKGDVIVCGSAGLFNSLHFGEIVKLLRGSSADLGKKAKLLAKMAKQRMLNPSPCALALAVHAQTESACCQQVRDVAVIVAQV